MKQKQLFDLQRVETTAAFIAAELKALLDRRRDGYMSRRIAESCPTWKAGLTIGETVFATLRALSMVQLEVGADLASLHYDSYDDEDEEVNARGPEPTDEHVAKSKLQLVVRDGNSI